MERNLKKARASGRSPAIKKSSGSMKPHRKSGSIPAVGRSSSRHKAVGLSSSKLSAVSSVPPESDLFRAMLPPMGHDTELESLREEIATLRRLQEVVHFLGSATDPYALRTEILDLAISLTNMPRGMLALPTTSNGKRRYKVRESRGYDESSKPEVKFLRGILNRGLERRETFVEGSIRQGGILDHAGASARRLKLGGVVCLPLEAQGELWGALILDDPKRNEPFSPAEESLIRSFARHAALALARLHKASQVKKRLSVVSRKRERLEAERDQLEQQLQRAQSLQSSQGRGGRSSSQSARHDRSAEKAGREFKRLIDGDYTEAKKGFTRRYLKDLVRRTQGDLHTASQESGLPPERLIALMERLDVEVPRKSRPRTGDHRSSTASGWGAGARK
jgi:GAF domain-containing protein